MTAIAIAISLTHQGFGAIVLAFHKANCSSASKDASINAKISVLGPFGDADCAFEKAVLAMWLLGLVSHREISRYFAKKMG